MKSSILGRFEVSGLTILIALTLTSASALAGGPVLYEQGAAAMGQSSAVVARPDDPTAIFYNPAGLAWQEGVGITAGGTFLLPTFSHTFEDNTVDAISKTYFTPNLFVSYRVHDQVSIGLGAFSLFGLGVEWPRDWVGREVALYSELTTFTINPCVVYRPLDWLAIGAGFDTSFVSLEIRQLLNSGWELWDVHLGGATVGFGGNAGILVKPLDWLSIGASYRSAMPLSATGRADFDVHPSFQANLPDQEITTDITLPHLIVPALAFRPIEGLSFEVDAEIVLWSSFDELRIKFDSGMEQATDFSWRDVVNIRAGVEYVVPDIDLAVRAGYVYDMNAVPDRTLNPLLPDANRHDISGGLGYSAFGFTLDAAYMVVMLQERTVTVENNEVLPGTYNGIVHLVATHLTYNF
ncbi:MAG: outer membrane protein transport protein [Bradymonadales bacterium]|nr:outer membrane protein transport protein [Bradymonadales bacterium]